jgi:hypothetical protein
MENVSFPENTGKRAVFYEHIVYTILVGLSQNHRFWFRNSSKGYTKRLKGSSA